MMSEATAVLKLADDHRYRTAVRGLEQFSHVWITFVFHKAGREWHPLIETPRLEAPKMGVFATRSPHRPNPIGLSVVKLERVVEDAPGGVELHLSGVDILDGTPVLDVKPYVPYADSVADANSGWIVQDIEQHPVEFSPESLAVLERLTSTRHPRIKQLLTQMLQLDPRPTSQRRAAPIADPKSKGLRFAFRVLDVDVHWQIDGGCLRVVQIEST